MNATSRTGRSEDLRKIDIDDLDEVERVADELGVTTTTLLAAVDTVGTRLDKIRDFLDK